MSSLDIYHYAHESETQHLKPVKHSVDNGSAFVLYVHQSFGVDLSRASISQNVQQIYNELIQNCNEPEWRKIVATFASDGTYILDEDRRVVADSLRIAENQLGLSSTPLSGLASILQTLPSGLSVCNYSVMGCCVCEDDEDKTVWLSKREIKGKFLRAAVPSKWTYSQD